MTQLEFTELLKKHDWYYYFSDDNRQYVAGENAQNKIDKLRRDNPKFEKLYQKYKPKNP